MERKETYIELQRFNRIIMWRLKLKICGINLTAYYEDTCIYAILNKEWKNNKNR